MGLLRDLFDLASVREENRRLREQLELERTRHLVREDALVDQVLTACGRYGLQEKTVERPVSAVSAPTPPPLIRTALEEAQFRAFVECANDEGRSVQEAAELFKRFRQGEKMPFQTQEDMITN